MPNPSMDTRSRLKRVSRADASLCQRKGNHADAQKQNYVNGATQKLRLDGDVILFFHFLVLGGCAVGRFFYSEARQNVKMFRKNVKKAPPAIGIFAGRAVSARRRCSLPQAGL